tara:strand:- start:4025 stop:4177 length:153 start_codon:yes stop_codon:yes gene_type:complete
MLIHRRRAKLLGLVSYFPLMMILIGRTSMMAIVFMTASYLLTGQIIPGVA